ncbi:MAG: 5'/3'-nucleotidase SurE [Fibrobacter sp.]|nr:5'/3'-nucleotidase SurE [Fibrobacter sp.]
MITSKKMNVLITNDDGYQSANLRALAEALTSYANVFVFAPFEEQSGASHAFTVRHELVVKKHECASYELYSVEGTPADCAKFAIGHFAKEMGFRFDVCFSGINIGENSGVSAIYSGTVGGAREAALWDVPGIALSLHGHHCDMLDESIEFAKRVVKERLFDLIDNHTFWNVNFPKREDGPFMGYKATKMSLGMFTDHYSETPKGWQLDGEKLWRQEPEDSDDYSLYHGYATITPLRIDQTDKESLKKISERIEVK